jgi:hypothetical protein
MTNITSRSFCGKPMKKNNMLLKEKMLLETKKEEKGFFVS